MSRNAPPSGPPRRPISLWKVWAVILFLFAIAFAIAWNLVKGSVRRAEERRRVGVSLPLLAGKDGQALKIGA